jgi:hypothetical protein
MDSISFSMSSDDSLSWLLKQVTEVARTIGQARKGIDSAVKGMMDPRTYAATSAPQQPPLGPLASSTKFANPPPLNTATPSTPDPLVIAATNEGIDTKGKTRGQIAAELAIKLNGNRK